MMEPFPEQRRVFVTLACDCVCECIYILYIKTNLLTPKKKKKEEERNRLINGQFYFSKVRYIEIPLPLCHRHVRVCLRAPAHTHKSITQP